MSLRSSTRRGPLVVIRRYLFKCIASVRSYIRAKGLSGKEELARRWGGRLGVSCISHAWVCSACPFKIVLHEDLSQLPMRSIVCISRFLWDIDEVSEPLVEGDAYPQNVCISNHEVLCDPLR